MHQNKLQPLDQGQDHIVRIHRHRIIKQTDGCQAGKMQYFVSWKINKKKSWVSQDQVPAHLIVSYKQTKHDIDQSISLSGKKQPNKGEDIKLKKQKQSTKTAKLARKRSEQQCKQQISADKVNNKGQNIQNNPSAIHKTLQIDNISKSQQEQLELQLVADIEGSSDEDNYHIKSKKQKKQKTPKHFKVKSAKKQKREAVGKYVRQMSGQAGEVEERRTRGIARKNYKQLTQIQIKTNKNQLKKKVNFEAITKEIIRANDVQDLIIELVIQSGMVGAFRYFLVRLRNGQNVLISQKNMRLLFPRKLSSFYKLLVSRLATPRTERS